MDVGREQWPHVGASLVDPLLVTPREEIHDRCLALSPLKGEGRARPPMVCSWCLGRQEEEAGSMVGENNAK